MNRARRRALLDAHWSWTPTESDSCDQCGCDLEGHSYHGVTLACAGMVCCSTCAIDVVDDKAAKQTIEMLPFSIDAAGAEAAARKSEREAAEESARVTASAEDAAYEAAQMRLRQIA